jgi:hypothetical protein
MSDETTIVVPWHREEVRDAFLDAWGEDARLLLQQDVHAEGCARTKNAGVRAAMERGAEAVIVLDDDMRPSESCRSLDEVVRQHLAALESQPVEMFQGVTTPPNRGVPYFERTMTLPVACSLGWWDQIPDRDAARQLVEGATAPMTFDRRAVFGRWFAGSGMNIAFRPKDWFPWCQFIEGVGRFDDIWMFNLWAKEAYRRAHCFSFAGPTLVHARQSAVFQNLRDEAVHLERNETLWRDIAGHPGVEYDELRSLVPA